MHNILHKCAISTCAEFYRHSITLKTETIQRHLMICPPVLLVNIQCHLMICPPVLLVNSLDKCSTYVRYVVIAMYARPNLSLSVMSALYYNIYIITKCLFQTHVYISSTRFSGPYKFDIVMHKIIIIINYY